MSTEQDTSASSTTSVLSESTSDTVVFNVDEQIVTPWAAKCGKEGFNYVKLVEKFGCSLITCELIERFERLTGKKVHPWINRGIFFAHRSLDEILDAYEQGKPIFLYTGRGPTSEALHLGHLVPFMFTKWLQDVFDAYLVVQMADEEKFYVKDMDFDEIYRLGFENAKDIIACGFNPDKTYIFSQFDYSANVHFRNVAMRMKACTNVNTINKIFGTDIHTSVGQVDWAISQSAAAFSNTFEHILGKEQILCLVPYAIDQDPYFRLARDIAGKLNMLKPCSIMCQFLPALQGKEKMSSSIQSTGLCPTIFMTDSPSDIAKKVNRFAFSGGKDTIEEHRKHGADLSVDMSYQYLRYFMDDDQELERIADEYSSGRMLSGQIKKILIDILVDLTQKHQQIRNAVTPELLEKFYQC